MVVRVSVLVDVLCGNSSSKYQRLSIVIWKLIKKQVKYKNDLFQI